MGILARAKQDDGEAMGGRSGCDWERDKFFFVNFFAKIAHHIKILVNFADDSDEEEAEAASQSQHFVDGGVISTEEGVIEILSSNSKLGGLISSEDNLTMAPTSVAIPMPEGASVYALRCGAVVLSTAKVRQDLELR